MLKKIILVALGSWIMTAVIAQPPKNAVNFYKTGITLRDKGMYPEAMKAFKQATILYKKYDSAYLEMGNICVKLNRIDSAVSYYKKATVANPKQVMAYMSMGNIYRDNKSNIDSALLCYLPAVRIDSTDKVIFYSIAWCYNAKTKYDSAIIYAARALDLDNGYRPAYGELAHAYHASKKYNEAMEQFKKNIAISEVDLPMYYLGLCYLELNHKEEAQKLCDRLNKMGSKLGESLKKRIEAKH